MKTPFRSLITVAVAALALATVFAVPPAHAAKDVVFAVASTFTTTDPYDANDTLSQAMAKSFYEGLFGFDKDMKMIPVLAESYEVSKDGLVYTIKLTAAQAGAVKLYVAAASTNGSGTGGDSTLACPAR